MAHTLFLDARLHPTMVALKRRERTPLADPEWQQIPWTYHPKDVTQKLLDVMIQLAAILVEFDAIKAAKGTTTDTVKRRRRFFERCGCLHAEAESWLYKLEAGIGTHFFVAFKDGIPTESPMKHFGLAYTVSLYWTLCIGLYDQIRFALRDFSVSDAAFPPRDIHTWCDPEPYAFRTAHSANFFFRSDAGTFPAAMFTFPMGAAMSHFAYAYQTSHPAYLKLAQVFKHGEVGVLSGKFLRSLQEDADPRKDPMKTFNQEENPGEGFEH